MSNPKQKHFPEQHFPTQNAREFFEQEICPGSLVVTKYTAPTTNITMRPVYISGLSIDLDGEFIPALRIISYPASRITRENYPKFFHNEIGVVVAVVNSWHYEKAISILQRNGTINWYGISKCIK